MKVIINIDTDNAAFEDVEANEIYRVLRVAVKRIAEGDNCGSLRDIKGNTVGNWTVTG